MIRHHYGPWDKRYYHILAYLESKQLIQIVKHKNSFINGPTATARKWRERWLRSRHLLLLWSA